MKFAINNQVAPRSPSKAGLCKYVLIGILFTTIFSAKADETDEEICPCPDTSDPVAVLRCVLDEPNDGSVQGIGYCEARTRKGYPPYPPFDFKRPNVFRAYRILSVTDGKPYKGQPTKRITMEYDYVAQLSEPHPEGLMLCKLWRQTVTAYQTERGWIVSSPSNMGMEVKLKMILDADQSRLHRSFLEKNIIGIKELSTRIVALENAAYNCVLPPWDDWK